MPAPSLSFALSDADAERLRAQPSAPLRPRDAITFAMPPPPRGLSRASTPSPIPIPPVQLLPLAAPVPMPPPQRMPFAPPPTALPSVPVALPPFPFAGLASLPLPPLPLPPLPPPPPCAPASYKTADCGGDKPRYMDQYTVPCEKGREEGCVRCWDVVYATTCHNEPEELALALPRNDGKVRWSPLLGPSGHLERFSVQSHLVGAVVFAVYAAVRSFVADGHSTSGALATAVAAVTAVTYLSSATYHATAPDRELTTMTRVLDYTAIYLAIVFTALADLAIATRHFDGVPLQAVLDVPAAGTLASAFFLWRRLRVSKHDTWEPNVDGIGVELSAEKPLNCTIGMGLFGMYHGDQHHSPLRQGCSFILSGAYFVLVPAAMATLGPEVAGVAIGLQGAGFGILAFGFFLDRVLKWPNKALANGEARCMVCADSRGCVAHSHGLWHVLAVVSSAVCAVGREYALAHM